MKKENNKNRIRIFGSLRVMVLCSVFVAISIVCGKYLAFNVGDFIRFSFENLPIIFAGMAFGYIAGLWQQAAQKRHRMTCETCRQYAEAIRDCDR